MNKKFTADFETATWLKDETYVWAWAVCEIGNEENLVIDNSIETFIDFCYKEKNSTFYFHNLAFDGEFIIYYLLKNGFNHVEESKDAEDKTFTTLISDTGKFYQITVYFKKKNKKVHKVTFIDSLKIIPFKVDKIAKSFNLPISKLKIDYNESREIGHILTKEETEYIKNDVLIVAKALKQLFDENLTYMTEGSNALHDFKNMVSKSKYTHLFPVLDYGVDEDLRQSYKGGFTYLNPIYKEKDVENVTILDVNSLYPSVMYEKSLPFGEPIFFEGKYEEDKVYNLYVQMISCRFEIKKDKIPTIQIKNSWYVGNEYLESSRNKFGALEMETLVLTNIDLQLFKEQYNVYDIDYVCGWKFKSIKGIFSDYIDKWITRKNNATLEGNEGQRTLAKLMLNSLYGKFATSLDVQSKIPFLGDDDIVHYRLSDEKKKDGLYLPIASFITSYAREKTIRTSQAIKTYSLEKYRKRYVYLQRYRLNSYDASY